METQLTTTETTGVCHISIKAKIKHAAFCMIMAALLMFGYGDGFFPSALTYSPPRA